MLTTLTMRTTAIKSPAVNIKGWHVHCMHQYNSQLTHNMHSADCAND